MLSVINYVLASDRIGTLAHHALCYTTRQRSLRRMSKEVDSGFIAIRRGDERHPDAPATVSVGQIRGSSTERVIQPR